MVFQDFKNSILFSFIVIGFFSSGLVRAELRNTTSVTFDPNKIAYAEPPEGYNEDSFYKHYVEKNDNQIEQSYRDQWSYQDSQLPYALTYWHYEHISLGTTNYFGRGPYEGDVRAGFANTVFNTRINSAIRTYLEKSDRVEAYKKAQVATANAVKKVNSGSIKLSDDPRDSGELRFGYDIYSDASRIEYVRGKTMAGLYNPNLLFKPSMSIWTVSASTEFAPGLPRASVSYKVNGDTIDAALSKPLAKDVDGTLASTQPFRPTATPSSYSVTISYRF